MNDQSTKNYYILYIYIYMQKIIGINYVLVIMLIDGRRKRNG